MLRRQLCTLPQELGLRSSGLKKALVRQRVRPARPPPVRFDGPVARVAEVSLRGDTTAEALLSAYPSDVYESCEGWRGSLLLLDRNSHTVTSVTMWDRQDDLDAAAQRPEYGEAMAALGAHFVGVPETRTWELGAAILPKPGGRPRATDESARA